ncbi:MAG: LD-carboxypeptidase [Simkaniaceae bacterium]|nr:LD-carboxypeptidase [Simkaniaceae bacterium]
MKRCFGIVFPSAKPDDEMVKRVTLDLEGRGFKVKIGEWGDDEVRAKNFIEMWCDPEVDVVWAGRGGYGAMRILPLLDYEAIKANPKPFVGMSDITALHLAIHKETGLQTFLGPMIETYLNSSFARDHFFEALSQGVIDGDEIITGGNLALIAATIGTQWEIETKNKTLLLEDVAEEAYRIDRMLCQLKLSGKLDGLTGVILASWARCSGNIEKVFDDYFSDVPYPVIRGFPSGHIDEQITIPLNCPTQIHINVY